MTIRICMMLVFGALLSACTASPPKPPANSAPAGQTSAEGGDQSAALDKKAREMGYRVETRNGERAYCHNSAPTASHISRVDCLSAAGMIQLVQNAEKSQDELARRQQQTYSGGPGSINW
jgi:hypothetical protein